MPEGPEIRRAADRLAEAVVGKRLASAWFAFPALKRLEKSLPGAVIQSHTPHGNALLTRFDTGWSLYSHNQLSGVWWIADSGGLQHTTRTLLIATHTAHKAHLFHPHTHLALLSIA